METKGKDQAFGYGLAGDEKAGWLPENVKGMTKREHFAAQAMIGFIPISLRVGVNSDEIAKKAVELADALIKALNQPNEEG